MNTAQQRQGAQHPPGDPPAAGALAKQPNGGVPAAGVDFGDDAGAGLEGMGMGEQLTPFLRMLQGLSPELNPSKAEHVPGAQLGMIINSATRELFSGQEGLDILICAREYSYGQWIPRDLGGGFRGSLPLDDPLVKETIARMTAKYGSSAKFKLPRYRDGKWSDEPPRTRDTDEAVELVETGQLYCIYGPPGGLDEYNAARALVAMTSTALPVYQGFNTRHASWKHRHPDGRMLPAPLWAYRWRLTTRPDKNNKGEFFNWNLSLAPVEPYGVKLGPGQVLTYHEALISRANPIYELGRAFYTQYREGLVKADYEAARDPGQDDPNAAPF